MAFYPEPDMDERTKHVREYDKRRQKRADRLFHWSLGMPPEEDDMNVQANRVNGLSWKEMATAGAIAIAGWLVYDRTADSQPPPPAPPAVTQPIQPVIEPVSGTIRFWTDDGTVIEEAR